MSAFKDAVQADVKNVFINALEFADEHVINGRKVRAVVDSDVTKERPSVRMLQGHGEGVFLVDKVIYIDVRDIPRRPVHGEVLRLDGERYLVTEVNENMGVLEITISANEA